MTFYLVTKGDYNDVYSKQYFKGTPEQIEEYVNEEFSAYDTNRVQDLGSDTIGLGVYYQAEESDDLEIEYYVEAEEIRDKNEIEELEKHLLINAYESFFHYGIIVDLGE